MRKLIFIFACLAMAIHSGASTPEQHDMDNTIYLNFNGTTVSATLVDNSSTRALLELLTSGPVTIHMTDYGNMEKVGPLPQSLPRNDEPIDTEAGDLILYQGRNFVIYYDHNSWNFTRLGKIDNIESGAALKSMLGEGDVNVTVSRSHSSGIADIVTDTGKIVTVYDLKGNRLYPVNNDLHTLAPGLYIVNGQKRQVNR